MAHEDQSRRVAVARLQAAHPLRDPQLDESGSALGSPSEMTAFANLHAAVDHFAAREASLVWLDRRYES